MTPDIGTLGFGSSTPLKKLSGSLGTASSGSISGSGFSSGLTQSGGTTAPPFSTIDVSGKTTAATAFQRLGSDMQSLLLKAQQSASAPSKSSAASSTGTASTDKSTAETADADEKALTQGLFQSLSAYQTQLPSPSLTPSAGTGSSGLSLVA